RDAAYGDEIVVAVEGDARRELSYTREILYARHVQGFRVICGDADRNIADGFGEAPRGDGDFTDRAPSALTRRCISVAGSIGCFLRVAWCVRVSSKNTEDRTPQRHCLDASLTKSTCASH